jgi:hypothetical protein
MDPITSAIVAALAADILSNISGEAITDTYQALKTAIQKKSRDSEDVIKSIESLERRPESRARQEIVAEEIASARLMEYPELIEHAQEILTVLKETGGDPGSLSTYNMWIENSEVGVIGDHAHIEGGIHFGGN